MIMIPSHELVKVLFLGGICVPSSLEAYLIHSDISVPISPILPWLVGNLEEVCVFEVK